MANRDNRNESGSYLSIGELVDQEVRRLEVQRPASSAKSNADPDHATFHARRPVRRMKTNGGPLDQRRSRYRRLRRSTRRRSVGGRAND